MPGYLYPLLTGVETSPQPDAEESRREHIAGDEDADADNPEGNCAWE